jgi:hypothetical protein
VALSTPQFLLRRKTPLEGWPSTNEVVVEIDIERSRHGPNQWRGFFAGILPEQMGQSCWRRSRHSGESDVLRGAAAAENHAEVFATDYSYRSATMGSSLIARRAGM